MNCNTITEAQKAAWMREGAEEFRKQMIQKMEGMQAYWSRLPVVFSGELRAVEMFIADLESLEATP